MLRFACAAVLLLTFSSATLADLIVEARETGGDVVFTTSGSLNLTGWDEGLQIHAAATLLRFRLGLWELKSLSIPATCSVTRSSPR